MKSNVISLINLAFDTWIAMSDVCHRAKIWLLFCYLFNSGRTALFLWAAQKVEDVLKWSCLLLILFFSWSTSIPLLDWGLSPRAPSPVLHVAVRSCTQCSGVQSKAALSHQLYRTGSQHYWVHFTRAGNTCPQLQWLQHVPEVRSTFKLPN